MAHSVLIWPVMKANYFHRYPILSAGILAIGTLQLVTAGFLLLDTVPDESAALEKIWLRLGGAAALWVLGCGMTSRSRRGSWKAGIACGLFFLPGLLLLIFLTERRREQASSSKFIPGLARSRGRRQYRQVKPLY